MQLLFVLLATLTSGQLAEQPLTSRGAAMRIAVVGDTGGGAAAVAEGIARVHAAKSLDAIIVTGDNFYPCGVISVADTRWNLIQPLTRIGIPIFPVLGNHDYCGKADPDAQVRATGLIDNWRFPAREYAVRSPVADLAFLDTTPFVSGKNRVLETTLERAFRTSGSKWRIVVGHHPVISSGYHGYRPRSHVSKMRELIPLLRRTKADVFVAGHDHHLELIRGRMLHVISGAGSEPIPPVKLRLKTVFPNQIGVERIGFVLLEITEKEIRVRMYNGNGRARSEWIAGRRR